MIMLYKVPVIRNSRDKESEYNKAIKRGLRFSRAMPMTGCFVIDEKKPDKKPCNKESLDRKKRRLEVLKKANAILTNEAAIEYQNYLNRKATYILHGFDTSKIKEVKKPSSF